MENAILEYSRPEGKYSFHLLGLVHLPVSRRFMGCAFTQKIEKLSRMLLSKGHKVYLYGAEGSDAPCTEFIQTHTLNEIRDTWGEGDNRFELGYNWKGEGFRHDFNTKKTNLTQKFYKKVSEEIIKRKKDDHFLLLTQGVYQKPIADQVGIWLTIEPGIGYRGSFTNHKAFESAYLQNFTYGSKNPYQSINGNYYDRVIPNYFDAQDFPFVPKSEREDYFFFIGRLIDRKGIHTAIKVADYLGKKLFVAGQGDMKFNSRNVEHVGYVEPEERAKLLGHAQAVFVPTIYLEAFGGVHVEAMLTGTPPITTNFAVFNETIQNGINGYRCDTLYDFVKAGAEVHLLDNKLISEMAIKRFEMYNVMEQYQKWFDDLYQLYLSTCIEGEKGWHWLP